MTKYCKVCGEQIHPKRVELGYSITCVKHVGTVVGKDHTTVIHSKRVYYNLCRTDEYFNMKAQAVERRVKVLVFGNQSK